MQFKFLAIIISIMIIFSTLANTIKVKISYSDMEGMYEDYKVAKTLDFSYDGSDYSFVRDDRSCKSYTFKIDNKEEGKLTLEHVEKTYQWVFNWKEDNVVILFGDYNDPRELAIKYNDREQWWMQNLEPDCNSEFDLYKKKPSEVNDASTPFAKATAKRACGASVWKIAVNDGVDIPEPVFVSHVLASSLAITVRAIFASDE